MQMHSPALDLLTMAAAALSTLMSDVTWLRTSYSEKKPNMLMPAKLQVADGDYEDKNDA